MPQPIASMLRDEKVRAVVYQVACVGAVAACAWYLFSNATENLARQDIASGFGYLNREAGFPISDSVIPFDPRDSHGKALIVGLLNTIKVSLLSIVLGTVLGTLVGIARLSRNPLLARLALWYVEALRNVPLLLYLLLWYAVIIFALPPARQAVELLPDVFVSNSGLVVPSVSWRSGFPLVAGACLAGLAAAVGWLEHKKRLQSRSGRAGWVWGPAMLLLVGPIVLALASGYVGLDVSRPELGRFRLTGGAHLKPEFVALLLGLSLSTSASIAEIVRAGIIAVNRGQREASAALGLNARQTMKLVVFPQAMRIIIPPTTNIYVTTFKNSSLAIAIGYPDLVMVSNTTMNQTGQAIEAIALFMAVYLGLSLITSLLMNWYNARVALKER